MSIFEAFAAFFGFLTVPVACLIYAILWFLASIAWVAYWSFEADVYDRRPLPLKVQYAIGSISLLMSIVFVVWVIGNSTDTGEAWKETVRFF